MNHKISVKYDHVTLDKKNWVYIYFLYFLMFQRSYEARMIKSNEEIEIIKNGARIADLGGRKL